MYCRSSSSVFLSIAESPSSMNSQQYSCWNETMSPLTSLIAVAFHCSSRPGIICQGIDIYFQFDLGSFLACFMTL